MIMRKKNIIYIVILCLCTNYLVAQKGGGKPLQLSFGSIKTELKEQALNFSLSYLQSLDTLWEKQDYLFAGDKSLFWITPDINIQTGNNDAFSSITFKMTGLAMLFDTITIDGIPTPDGSKLFHTFPSSIGFETNNDFSIINGIGEVGWVPWYQSAKRETAQWLKKTKFGVFIQGGYKFEGDSLAVQQVGGEMDQSMEAVNSGILRAKGSFAINTNSLVTISGVGFGLVGDSHLWYDFLNGETYYSIEGRLRMYLANNEEKYFDFHYQKGSGAPNFNQGEQYGVSLAVMF